jgi:hypothetical protein
MKFFDNILLYFIIAIVAVKILYTYLTPFSRTITIKSKNDFAGRRLIKNLVEDKDGNIYEVSNSLLHLQFTSAELWNRLEVGKTYTVKGYGLRVPFLGWYPDIISIA